AVALRAGHDYNVMAPAEVGAAVTWELGGVKKSVRFSSAKLDTIPIPVKWAGMVMAGKMPAGKGTLALNVEATMRDGQGVSVTARRALTLPIFFTTEPTVTLVAPVGEENLMLGAIQTHGAGMYTNVGLG